MRFTADDGSEFPDWGEKKLGDLYTVNNERNKEGQFKKSQTLSVATMQQKPSGNGDSVESVAISKVLRIGDVLFEGHMSKAHPLGRLIVNTNQDGIVSPRFRTFRPKHRINANFWKYFFVGSHETSHLLLRSTKAGIMMNEIVDSDFFHEKVCVPTCDEQQKIASLLSTVDSTLALCRRKLDLLTQAKKALMQQIFSRKLRFKADDGSEFPEWEEKSFSAVFKILKNNTLSRDKLNYKGGVAKNIHYGDVLIHYGALLDINDDIVPFINPKCNLPLGDDLSDGDIVIADTAEDETVGKATEIRGINSIHAYPGLHTIAVHPKDAYAPGFLGYLMNSEKFHSQLFPLMQGIKVTSVSKSSISVTTIVIPSLPEQKKIAACLSSADALIAQARAELEQWREVKKSLLQQLFV